MSSTKSLTMDKPVPNSLLDTSAQGIIGKPLDRKEGPLKVSGAATYAAEYQIENLAYGVLVGAPVGKGKVTGIDSTAAKALPGVIDVIVDLDNFLVSPAQGLAPKAPQGVEKVQYFGELVAIVLAESFEAARDAAQQVVVEFDASEDGRYDFEALKGDVDKPADADIPAHFSQGNLEKAMAEGAVTVDSTFTTPSQNSAAMEPHASIANWDDRGNLTIHGSYQLPGQDVKQLAAALGIRESKIRIVARYIGGGFGSKLGIAPESVAAALAAKAIGRPVKAVMARQQVFDATVRRSNTEQRIRLAATAEGKLTAMGHDTIASNLPDDDYFEPTGQATHFMYDAENREINHDLVRLDWLVSGSMRAPGEAVGMLALEGAMDELAEKLGIDPIEFRRMNEPEVDPEKQIPHSSRQLVRCMDVGAASFGWDKRNATPGSRREGEWLVGIGMAAAARANMLQPSEARVTLSAAGRATVETDMTDIGTGSYTILGQIAGEVLGLPLDQVDVELGDTRYPTSSGSGGSFGAGSAGTSVYLAAQEIREKLAKAMGVDEEAMTLKDGFAIADNRRVPIADLAGEGIEATGSIKPGKQEKETRQSSYGAHFAEVGVNAVTGEVRVRRMLGVFAAGRILNAKTARSQCLGGMTFGIGTALTEDLIHDPRNGKLVNRDLAEYHLPVNADVPQLEVEFLEERDIHANPMHAKGIGELGISGAGAAIANAVYNATGIRVRDYPLTLDKILEGLPEL